MGHAVSRWTARYTVVLDTLTPDTRDLRPDPGIDRTIRGPGGVSCLIACPDLRNFHYTACNADLHLPEPKSGMGSGTAFVPIRLRYMYPTGNSLRPDTCDPGPDT